ncbi:S24 family peptidase [Niabella sp. CJ426]|uniref:S24 family peptidase n=1 Tax=Niabella sp. CJ426 TaxID=3393740 RepID=UPI003D047B7D
MSEMFDLIESIKNKTGMTYTEISVAVGASPGYIAQLKARGRTSEKFTLKLREYDSRLTNGNIKKVHHLKFNATATGTPVGEYSNKNNSFVELSEGLFLMKTKLVTQKAKAGYLTGWGDDEFIESLPDYAITTDKPAHGIYRSFEISGDSMDNGLDDAIKNGDIATGRFIQRSLWSSKLHLHTYEDYIIVCYNGILCKRITEHNPETGDITIHSLNPDKINYPDEIINLNRQVMQIFNIVDISRKRKKK